MREAHDRCSTWGDGGFGRHDAGECIMDERPQQARPFPVAQHHGEQQLQAQLRRFDIMTHQQSSVSSTADVC